MDCSPQGSSVHGILQVRYWSWVTFPFLGSFLTQGLTLNSYISCIGRGILYHWCHLWSLMVVVVMMLMVYTCCHFYLFTTTVMLIYLILNFHWNIVALQCCVSFYCKAKWISSMCTYSPLFFWISFLYMSPQGNEKYSLCYTVGSH